MSHTCNGFVAAPALVDNTPEQTAIVFELSELSRSFAKDKGSYSSTILPQYDLTTFTTVDENNAPVQLSQLNVNLIIRVVDEIVTYDAGHVAPHDLSDFQAAIISAVFGNAANVILGPLVVTGSKSVPEWVTFTTTIPGQPETNCKIWLADAAFQIQYSNYEIEVIPPIANIDQLLGSYNTALGLVAAAGYSWFTQKIEEVRGQFPYTSLRFDAFKFVNRQNPSQFTPVNWAVLIYGPEGNDLDVVKEAIVHYIEANTAFDMSIWRAVFPELFTRVEIVYVPLWDRISIENQTPTTSMYSSVAPLSAIEEAIAKVRPEVDAAYRSSRAEVMYGTYKTIAYAAIGGETNPPQKQRVTELFPDYLPIDSNSADFPRMSVPTQQYVLKLNALTIAAETMTKFTAVPQGVKRVVRGDKVFASLTIDNIRHMVYARSNT